LLGPGHREGSMKGHGELVPVLMAERY
jgi:hypothetical protein